MGIRHGAKTKTNTPFKKLLIGGEWDEIFRLPSNALKLWMFYYRLEGANREGWSPNKLIAQKLDMTEEMLTSTREYLVEHGWLQQVREIKASITQYPIPVMRCHKGTVPEKVRKVYPKRLAGLKKARAVKAEKKKGQSIIMAKTEGLPKWAAVPAALFEQSGG